MKLLSIVLLVGISTLINAEEVLNLPDPLITNSGKVVASVKTWEQVRRPEILELFRKHVYGRAPDTAFKLSFDAFDEDSTALNGKAIRKQVAITAVAGERSLRIELLLYLPISAKQQPVPVMVVLNFGGNHTINSDPAIVISKNWMRKEYSPPEKFRGKSRLNYPLEEILARGYGFATAYYGDIDPDFDDGFKNGIHPLLDPSGERAGDAWGAVGAWAWGLSRFMDYFEVDKHVDQTKVALLGHSRLGKTALWAGAQDERVSIVISNDSGCTGAALARRRRGETVARINKSFPHWFCRNYKQYNDKEDALPVDQHMLIALIAPRPVYVASADKDLWADPEGEFLSCVHAESVCKLFGLTGLQGKTMPAANTPMNDGHIGYHVRAGTHALTAYDWTCYMEFAGKHWNKK